MKFLLKWSFSRGLSLVFRVVYGNTGSWSTQMHKWSNRGYGRQNTLWGHHIHTFHSWIQPGSTSSTSFGVSIYIYIYSHRTIYRTCQYIHMTWIVDLCNSRLVGKCTSPIDPKSIYVCIYYVGGHCTSSNNATPDRSGRVYAGRSRSFAAQYCFWDFCCVPRSIEPTRQECIWLFNHD